MNFERRIKKIERHCPTVPGETIKKLLKRLGLNFPENAETFLEIVTDQSEGLKVWER